MQQSWRYFCWKDWKNFTKDLLYLGSELISLAKQFPTQDMFNGNTNKKYEKNVYSQGNQNTEGICSQKLNLTNRKNLYKGLC